MGRNEETLRSVSDLRRISARCEALAEEIAQNRQQMIEFDRKRQSNREAARALRKQIEEDKGKVWAYRGDFFVLQPKTTVIEQIEKGRNG
mmetsp:Transcript_43818/g.114285  ORF Transcript_43818/g.114285 Transcript_43818/m.114285 type:complete len:90 (+) Transcript_43818:215-484(+)